MDPRKGSAVKRNVENADPKEILDQIHGLVFQPKTNKLKQGFNEEIYKAIYENISSALDAFYQAYSHAKSLLPITIQYGKFPADTPAEVIVLVNKLFAFYEDRALNLTAGVKEQALATKSDFEKFPKPEETQVHRGPKAGG